MALHAFNDIDDAVDATKALLLPFDWRRWLRFAVVALFLGGGASFPTSFGQSFGSGTTSPEPGMGSPDLPAAVGIAIIALVVLLLLLGLAFAVLSSLMEFVLFEALRTKTLEIRAGLRRNLGNGLRLFGFRILVGLAGVIPVIGFLVVAFLFPPLFLLALFAIPVFLVYYIVLGVFGGFTTMFVVPLMLEADIGIVAGWKRLWPAVRSNLKQFGAYAFMGFVLNIAAGFLVGFGVLFAALLLAIPFGVVFGGLFFLLGGPAAFAGAGFTVTAGLVVGVIGAVLYAVALLVATGYVQAPVMSFLRYYAVFVLGDIDADLDPIEDVRREVRADGGEPEDGGPATDDTESTAADDAAGDSSGDADDPGEFGR